MFHAVVLLLFQVVKRSIEISMDYSAAKQQKVAQLMQALHGEEIVRPSQFIIGFKRLFEQLPLLRCDVPAADAILNGFVAHGKRVGYLPATYQPPSWLETHSSEEEFEVCWLVGCLVGRSVG